MTVRLRKHLKRLSGLVSLYISTQLYTLHATVITLESATVSWCMDGHRTVFSITRIAICLYSISSFRRHM